MKIEIHVEEDGPEVAPLAAADFGMATWDPAPMAKLTLKLDDEVAIELTGAHWTIYPAFARMKEMETFLAEAHEAAQKKIPKEGEIKIHIQDNGPPFCPNCGLPCPR